MSFGLRVIPGEQNPISFAAFKQCWLAILADFPELELDNNIGLSSSRMEVELKDVNLLESGSRLYINHTASSTLAIGIYKNAEIYIDDEVDYLEYYAQADLEPTEVVSLAKRWQLAGYSFMLTTYVGRDENEVQLMCLLAMALASCTNGRVLVTDGNVFPQVGVFTPDEFSKLFPGNQIKR